MGRRMNGVMVGSVLLSVLAVVACGDAKSAGPDGSPTESAEPRPLLLLTFGEVPPGETAAADLGNQGTAEARIDLISVGKVATTVAPGLDSGSALALPAYAGRPAGPFAAVRVRERKPGWLSPGGSRFSVGADVKLDARSMGTEADNGDNVLQRGLFGDPSQYKIQVDKRRASCVIRGTAGTLVVKSKLKLDGDWYRLRCRRSAADEVTLTVTRLGTEAAPEQTVATGPIGDVAMTDGAPLSVGAKLGADGKIVVSSTDQFNGDIDNVTYTRE